MACRSPGPLTPAERRARRNRAARIARQLGFLGSVEYRHVYSQSGGAQYGRGNTPEADLLTVYAGAFERDADPEDFSLEAMIALECVHQILARHPRIAKRVAGISDPREEILASLLGAMICNADADRVALFAKAAAELSTTARVPSRQAGGFRIYGTYWRRCYDRYKKAEHDSKTN